MIGVGQMGGTVLDGLLASGHPADRLVVGHASAERAAEIGAAHGVPGLANVEAVRDADVVVVAVKPHLVAGVLDEIGVHLGAGAVVVSLAVGLSTRQLQGHLPAGVAVVRVMPNTPSKVGEGMAVVSPGDNADASQVRQVVRLMRSVGRVVEVPENLQDAATAVSGSGPAYVFLVAEAMIEAGVHLGLPRATSRELAVQTLFGAAMLLRDTGEHPGILRENVTSPGGTTAAALRSLEDHGLRAAFLDAMAACRDRSVEISRQQ